MFEWFGRKEPASAGFYRVMKECGIASPMMNARITDGGRRGGFCQGVEVPKVSPVYPAFQEDQKLNVASPREVVVAI